jgi:hypothetical protein
LIDELVDFLGEENDRLSPELSQAEIAPKLEHGIPEIILQIGDQLKNPTEATIWIPDRDEFIYTNLLKRIVAVGVAVS